jgi:alcohol dehydrogenase class IV
MRKNKVFTPQNKTDYIMPTKVYFGRGSAKKVLDIINKSPHAHFLLVTGSHFKKNPLFSELKKSKKVKVYEKDIKKSDFATVNALVKSARDFDAIIGIGGGAILDSVKLAAALAVNGGNVEDYVTKNTRKIEKKGLLILALPTTSGTGSEVTPWSVIWSDKKYSLSSVHMFPDIAIVDPALTDDCPTYVTATSGIDALCQAVEAYWNVKHNAVSDNNALDAIATILGSFEKAVNHPDEDSRDNMAWGSLLGGLAFSNTQTTICHSVSYPMTVHWGIAHGQATSITLPSFIEYTFGVLKKREKAILKAFGVSNKKAAAEKIRRLMQATGLKTRLSELGIPKKGIDIIVAEGFDPARAGNAPKIPTPEELKEMLTSLY